MPAAMAVVDVEKARRIESASGKAHLMERIRELSGDGEAVLAFLMGVVKGNGNVKEGLAACRLLLEYGYGRPVETMVTADLTPRDGQKTGVASLTTAQLEAVVNAPHRLMDVEPEEEGEIVDVISPAPVSTE